MFEAISAEAIADEALSQVRQMAIQKDLELTLKVEPVDLHVLADPGKLKQMLGNLLSNAVKFTPSNGHVSLVIRLQEDRVLFDVCIVLCISCLCICFFLMIRRPPRSTLDRSSAASDVYKRQG